LKSPGGRVFLVAAIFALAATGLWIFTPTGWIESALNFVRSLGAEGTIAYVLVFVIATIMLVPSTPFVLAAGFLYGVVTGTIVVVVASILSAVISFLMARYRLRSWIGERLQRYPRLLAFDDALEREGLKMVLLMRLQPVFLPFVYLNMALGLTKVRWRDFIVGSLLGMLPGQIAYVYGGSLIRSISELSLSDVSRTSATYTALTWIGLGALVGLVVVTGRIARQILTRRSASS
jgi:uncharacterized membrane protein YdjX (TVP38/TMEM64 family)